MFNVFGSSFRYGDANHQFPSHSQEMAIGMAKHDDNLLPSFIPPVPKGNVMVGKISASIVEQGTKPN